MNLKHDQELVFQHDFESSLPHCQISPVSQPKVKKKITCESCRSCGLEQHSFLTNNVVFKKRHITRSAQGSRYMTSSFTEYTHFLLAWLKVNVSFIKVPSNAEKWELLSESWSQGKLGCCLDCGLNKPEVLLQQIALMQILGGGLGKFGMPTIIDINKLLWHEEPPYSKASNKVWSYLVSKTPVVVICGYSWNFLLWFPFLERKREALLPMSVWWLYVAATAALELTVFTLKVIYWMNANQR